MAIVGAEVLGSSFVRSTGESQGACEHGWLIELRISVLVCSADRLSICDLCVSSEASLCAVQSKNWRTYLESSKWRFRLSRESISQLTSMPPPLYSGKCSFGRRRYVTLSHCRDRLDSSQEAPVVSLHSVRGSLSKMKNAATTRLGTNLRMHALTRMSVFLNRKCCLSPPQTKTG